jgi:hypothetical protein
MLEEVLLPAVVDDIVVLVVEDEIGDVGMLVSRRDRD